MKRTGPRNWFIKCDKVYDYTSMVCETSEKNEPFDITVRTVVYKWTLIGWLTHYQFKQVHLKNATTDKEVARIRLVLNDEREKAKNKLNINKVNVVVHRRICFGSHL